MNSTSEELQKQNVLIAANQSGVGIPAPTFLVPTIAPDDVSATQGLIPNLLDNSDFDYSKDAYLNATPVGGDDAKECYNFYRNRLIQITDLVTTNGSTAVTSASNPFDSAYSYPLSFVIYGAGASGETLTGTLTRVSDGAATLSTNTLADLTDAVMWFGDTLDETSAQALKASGHSLYAANEGTDSDIPDWDTNDGWVEIGSATRWSLDAPLPLNIIRPGLTLFALCIVKVRPTTTAIPDGVSLFFGAWDATSGQNKWIEGANFDLDVTPVGTTGSTTVSYKAIGHLDDGSTIESDTVTITNSNAVLSAANYNRLTWANAPGILDFTLYRSVGGVVTRIFTITNGGSDYNDTGGDEETLGAFPSTHQTKAIAYKETSLDFPTDAGWVAYGALINVPATYDSSLTTDSQWFRCGAVQSTASRNLLLDRIGLSFVAGGWNRSSRDLALIATKNPSASPVGSDQGGTGIGTCFSTSTLVKIKDEWKPIGGCEKGQYIWDGARSYGRIKKVRKAIDVTWLVVLENGAWCECTETERFITSRADKSGTMLRDLTYGDTIISPSETGVTLSPIVILEKKGEQEVVTLELYGGKKVFAVGNMTDKGLLCLLAHNRKDDSGLIIVQ